MKKVVAKCVTLFLIFRVGGGGSCEGVGRALKTAEWQRPPGKGHRPRWPLTPPDDCTSQWIKPPRTTRETTFTAAGAWRRELGFALSLSAE